MTTRKRKSGPAPHVATTAIALAGGGKAMLAMRGLMSAYRSVQERRLDALWREMLRSEEDPEAFAQAVEDALLRDGDAVANAFISAAQAAVSAVDPSALVSIGLLARRFINEHTPSRREFRAYLDMFQSLDAGEYGALRRAAHYLRQELGVKDAIRTAMTLILGAKVDQCRWSYNRAGRGKEGEHLLASGAQALQIIRGLEAVLEARGVPTESSRTNPTYPREVIELLVAVIPAGD